MRDSSAADTTLGYAYRMYVNRRLSFKLLLLRTRESAPSPESKGPPFTKCRFRRKTSLCFPFGFLAFTIRNFRIHYTFVSFSLIILHIFIYLFTSFILKRPQQFLRKTLLQNAESRYVRYSEISPKESNFEIFIEYSLLNSPTTFAYIHKAESVL